MRPRLVLVGGGHAHAGVLRAQALHRSLNADITIVTASALAPYSGMLPGWMAGHYSWQQICLDFAALAARAGARCIEGEALELDLSRKTLRLRSGESLAFDFLSLNIGSTHRPPVVGDGQGVLALRPLGSLLQRTQMFVESHRGTSKPLSVRVVGAGGAGFEMALATQHRLQQTYPGRAIDVRIITDSQAPLPTHAPAAQRLAAKVLRTRGVALITRSQVDKIEGRVLHLARLGDAAANQPATQAHTSEHADQIIWAGGAQPHQWPQHSGLALDARGFIAVNAALQSRSHPFVFASGDCAGMYLPNRPPLPKAGVYPVKQGPVLAANLAGALIGRPLADYAPQPRALGLFATGPKHALGSYGPLAFSGAWVWYWKNRIDRAFLAKHAGTDAGRSERI